MSKLSKKISRIQRREGGGFGFAAPHREPPRAMLLGALVQDPDAIARAKSADVIIVRGQAAAVAIAKAGESEAALGAWVDELTEESAAALHEAGCDFVVSTLGGTAAVAVDTDRMGQVLAPDGPFDDTTLRALGPLGLDAILVESERSAMTLRQQLELVRVSSFASTPLMVTVAADTSVATLRVLRDSGTAIVLAPEGASAGDLESLGERLRQVPTPHRGRENGREVALVPSAPAHAEEDEDEPGEV